MQSLQLNASKRQLLGKKVSSLRQQGLTPANLYGHGVTSIPLQVDTRALRQLLAHVSSTDIVSLNIDGSSQPDRVMIRARQRHPVTQELLHIDFYKIKLGERIRIEVPLQIRGESAAVRQKESVLRQIMDSISLECLPDNLPHAIEVDISSLSEVDQALHVRDLPLPPGARLLTDPEQLVAKVEAIRLEEEEKAAPAEAATGEVAGTETEESS